MRPVLLNALAGEIRRAAALRPVIRWKRQITEQLDCSSLQLQLVLVDQSSLPSAMMMHSDETHGQQRTLQTRLQE